MQKVFLYQGPISFFAKIISQIRQQWNKKLNTFCSGYAAPVPIICKSDCHKSRTFNIMKQSLISITYTYQLHEFSNCYLYCKIVRADGREHHNNLMRLLLEKKSDWGTPLISFCNLLFHLLFLIDTNLRDLNLSLDFVFILGIFGIFLIVRI